MATSTDQDRKKKSLPLQTHEVPLDQQFEGEVIDGEIIEEDGPTAADHGEPKKQRSPGQPGKRRAEREQERSQAREGRRSSQKPSDPVSRLRQEVDEAGRKYMAELRRSDILTAKKTPKERSSQLTGIHKGYVSMMVLSCIQPLSEGINAKSVLSMVGMGSAMWALSPNFRNQVGDFGAQMKETITAKIDERRQSAIDKVLSRTADQAEAGKPLSQKWQEKLERAERAVRGGRDAYTAQSAGMTEVALTENAYAAMRVEGADVDEIRDTHFSMLKTLYEQAHEDGVEASEVATAARMVVGLRLEEEPELASVFGELSHGQFAKSDPREVRISGTGELAHVWTGEFESRLGQKIEAGSFGLRAPMDADQHQAAIADTMAADMISLTRQHGADGLNLGVVGYASAWGLRDRPDFDGMTAMDNPLGERLRTSRVMLNAMDSDNISSSEQQRIYSNAYVDAMENVSALYPEVEQEWAVKFGANWRENMRDFVSNPNSYMGQQGGESAASADQQGEWKPAPAWEAGPAGQDGYSRDNDSTQPSQQPTNTAAQTARKYRNARINQNYIQTSKTGVTGLGSDSSDFRDQDFEMGG
ncbi:UNVERIFIED_ORG: hypothetical protein ABIB52_000696 [Arthrobacter sp. UYCu721]